ncbi:alpha-1,2-fucosyltransferase [Plebeiibacterium marinum]|uniref:Alpha-1,2-fucosyltransferase n=1 Tax=Plebeiibacterium marinum TaxID=2992111 RepID=A0AAE3SLI1_9BACT|nr:alpha-1,2-fucosyltransferase [Plebeiobacterium marinum]MCW3807474.1 alpha-1,2-fucosyltransferase [Plebeiobacterium marinum]
MILGRYVIAKLPRTGLGNRLFVLYRALSYAYLNNSQLLITNIYSISIGPFIRKEQRKRIYLFSFNFSPFMCIKGKTKMILAKNKIYDPNFADKKIDKSSLIIFHSHIYKGIDHSDLFKDIRPFRSQIISHFYSHLSKNENKIIANLYKPVIGVHLRRGDFKFVNWELTSIEYIIKTINNIRMVGNKNFSVTIFTDAHKEEVKELLLLENIALSPSYSDLSDLVHLSKSKIIIASKNSTFSYWAGFFSEAAIILDNESKKIRYCEDTKDKRIFEGSIPNNPKLWPKNLIQYIKELS